MPEMNSQPSRSIAAEKVYLAKCGQPGSIFLLMTDLPRLGGLRFSYHGLDAVKGMPGCARQGVACRRGHPIYGHRLEHRP